MNNRFLISGTSLVEKSWSNQLDFNSLMYLTSASLFADMVLMSRFESFIGFGLALVGNAFLLRKREMAKFFNSIQSWGRKYKLNIAVFLFVLVGAVFILNYMAEPAAAQFFTKTESWLNKSFPLSTTGANGGVNVYSLVFTTLRALFVLYLAVALAKVIAAVRNDEDWQNLARTPLIILVTVVMGDILAGVITG